MTRGAATPIFYTLKITQDGLLSFAYSVSGGAYSYLIKDQSITASNGPLPASFRVGFAGLGRRRQQRSRDHVLQGGLGRSVGQLRQRQPKAGSKVEAGTQAYFAYYDPNDWTGTVTANTLIDTAGVVTVATVANWDCLRAR